MRHNVTFVLFCEQGRITTDSPSHLSDRFPKLEKSHRGSSRGFDPHHIVAAYVPGRVSTGMDALAWADNATKRLPRADDRINLLYVKHQARSRTTYRLFKVRFCKFPFPEFTSTSKVFSKLEPLVSTSAFPEYNSNDSLPMTPLTGMSILVV